MSNMRQIDPHKLQKCFARIKLSDAQNARFCVVGRPNKQISDRTVNYISLVNLKPDHKSGTAQAPQPRSFSKEPDSFLD